MANYRSVSLISVLFNILEQLLQKAFFCFPQSCDPFHRTGMAFFPTNPACLPLKWCSRDDNQAEFSLSIVPAN